MKFSHVQGTALFLAWVLFWVWAGAYATSVLTVPGWAVGPVLITFAAFVGVGVFWILQRTRS
jgi:hypothetical protein